MSRVRSVVVTGAGGFIGRWSVPPLLRAGFDVHAVLSAAGLGAGIPAEVAGATVHHTDLLRPASIDALFETIAPTHLLHFAWIATPGVYWQSPENERWLAAGKYLVERFQMRGGRRAVLAGSCAEYDWSQASFCDEVTTPLRTPRDALSSAYADSKILMQRWFADFGRERGLSTAWGRIFFQFGPYEHADRLVASVIRNLLACEPALCSQGTQRRSFLHSSDVGAAFAALLSSDVQGAVNIGSADAITVADLVATIASKTGGDAWVRLGARPTPPSEPPVLLPNVRRLRDEVGWSPRLDLSEGLDATIDWWRGRAG